MSLNDEMQEEFKIRSTAKACFAGDCFVGIDSFSIASGANHDLVITTGIDPVVIGSFHTLTNSGDFVLSLREDAVTSGGIPFAAFNADRTSTASPPVSAMVNPTVSDEGTLVFSAQYGGANSTSTVHDVKFDEPMILKPNCVYIYRWSHIDNGNRDFTISGAFYKDVR